MKFLIKRKEMNLFITTNGEYKMDSTKGCLFNTLAEAHKVLHELEKKPGMRTYSLKYFDIIGEVKNEGQEL